MDNFDKGFGVIHGEKQSKVQSLQPFYKIAQNEYDYEEMVDFQYNNGNRIALPYGYLVSVVMRENSTIQARYNNWEIIIYGRNLKIIYQALLSRTLKFVRKAENYEKDTMQNDVFIDDVIANDLTKDLRSNMPNFISDDVAEFNSRLDEEKLNS